MLAASINILPNISISFFNKPHALVISSDFNELLQTSSAKSSDLCASLFLLGFISYNFTFIPFLASIYAHSHPASPAPITFTLILFLSKIYLQLIPDILYTNYSFFSRKNEVRKSHFVMYKSIPAY